MQLFSEPKIDFMRYRKLWVAVSVVLVIGSVFSIFVGERLNLGIDFAGGTQLTIKFREEPQIDDIRRLVVSAGVDEALIQRFGDPGSGEVIIKTPTVAGAEEGSQQLVFEALAAGLEGGSAGDPGKLDVNRAGRAAVAAFLFERDPAGLRAADPEAARASYEEVAAAVLEVRRELGLISDWGQLEGVEGIAPESLATLRAEARLGPFSVLGAENVGPQIGQELRRKGIWAVTLSLLGMLVYIWLRFELRFGIGSLVAVTHDILITLGLYAWAGFEFNLTTIAAFLTLIGYSVNDSVVVFDRVRENLRKKRGEPLVEVMNRSLNQTLSRTVLTSATTLLAVGSLLFAGGDVLRGFAFILSIGVITGTYSSIYVASPFTILWEQLLGREARLRRREAKAA